MKQLIIFFLLSIHVFAISKDDVHLFSSSPLLEIAQSDICHGKGLIQNLIFPKSLKQNQFIGFGQDCGMHLVTFNFEEDKEIFESQKLMSFQISVLASTVPKNSSIFWMSDSMNVYAIDLNNLSKVDIISSQTRIESNVQPMQLLVDKNNLVLFILSKRKVETYWIEDVNNIKKLSSFDALEALDCIVFQNDSNHLVIGTDKKLIIYKVEFDKGNKNLIFGIPCKTPDGFTIEDFDFIENNFLILKSKFYGLWSVDFSIYLKENKCSNLNFIALQSAVDYNFFKSPIVTSNQKFLIVEEQFRTLQIFQIEVGKNGGIQFKLFQQISIENQNFSLKLDSTENNLIRAYKNKISIFSRISPNYDQEIPSIINGDQSFVQKEIEMVAELSRRCIVVNNYLYYSKISDGLFIFKIDADTSLLKRVSLYKPIKENYESATPFAKNSNQLIVGASSVHFVDSTDITNPKNTLITNFGYSGIDADHAIINKDETLLFVAAGKVGLIIVDIKDFKNPKYITQIYHKYENFQSASTENVILSDDQNYLYVCYREVVIITYDIQALNGK